jgi:hypothetical protein
MKIVALRYQWWGVCIGGKHYTGSILQRDGPTIELTRRLSQREAKALAENDERLWLSRETTTNRFNSLSQLERIALRWCRSNLGDQWLLQRVDFNGPYLPIGGRGFIEERIPSLTNLAVWWDAVPDHRRTDAVMDKAYDAWETLTKSPSNSYYRNESQN